MKRLVWMLVIPALLAGCDQLSERAGFPNPAKQEADGKAIGGACRHAGRGLEDCFRLNKTASKAAIYAGWKEMNEYMVKNNIQAVPPSVTPFSQEAAKEKHGEADSENTDGKDTKPGKGDEKAEAHPKDAGH